MGDEARVRLSRVFGALCGATVAVIAAPAQAGDSSYRLQIVRADGAASCPSEATIERDVAQRLRRNPFSDDGERGVEVVLERSEGRWRARLYLRVDASDGDPARSLESDAPDCSELGRSVALAVALAIAPELPPEPPPTPAPPAPVCPEPIPPPPPEEKSTWNGALALRLGFSPNLLPHPAPGATLAVSLRGALLGVSAGAAFFPEREQRRGDADVGFGLSSGFLSGCLWARTHDPQVWSCVGARVGALHSVVYAPNPVSAGDHWWWAASSELGVRQTLFGRAFVEIGAAAIFPLVRQRFVVEGAASGAGSAASERGLVYEQGPAAIEGFLGFGVRID